MPRGRSAPRSASSRSSGECRGRFPSHCCMSCTGVSVNRPVYRPVCVVGHVIMFHPFRHLSVQASEAAPPHHPHSDLLSSMLPLHQVHAVQVSHVLIVAVGPNLVQFQSDHAIACERLVCAWQTFFRMFILPCNLHAASSVLLPHSFTHILQRKTSQSQLT